MLIIICPPATATFACARAAYNVWRKRGGEGGTVSLGETQVEWGWGGGTKA